MGRIFIIKHHKDASKILWGTMIRPASEIEFPPSEFLRTKAKMIARMESLNNSTQSLMGVIAARVGAQNSEDFKQVEAMNIEQERLIANMRRLVKS